MTTVVGDTVDGGVVHDDRAVVDVGDPRGVDVVDGAVVVEVMALPVATVVAAAGVAVAVVDATVEADVRAPEAAMQDVAAAEEAPVGGGPKSAVEGGGAPCAGNPVVADGSVSPVAGGPEIVGGGGFGLLVDGEWWRRRGGFFDGLLAGVYLIVRRRGVVVVVLVIVGSGGLSGLSGAVGLILLRRRSRSVLFGALLGLGLGTDAEDSALRGWRGCGLGLAVVDGRHVGVGWVGAVVVGDGRWLDSFVTSGDGYSACERCNAERKS